MSSKRIDNLRDEMVYQLQRWVVDKGGNEYEMVAWITCNYCSDKESCEFSYDLYNTNGDCLAEK